MISISLTNYIRIDITASCGYLIHKLRITIYLSALPIVSRIAILTASAGDKSCSSQ